MTHERFDMQTCSHCRSPLAVLDTVRWVCTEVGCGLRAVPVFVHDRFAMGDIKRFRPVIVETPFRGRGLPALAFKPFATACTRDSFMRGEAPLLSHVLYTDALHDEVPEERDLGILAGLAWGLAAAKATVVYTDCGVSEGMHVGIRDAERVGRPVIYRKLNG